MAENSKIEWTHHTFNPWRGCTKVSAGCANCYAETLSGRNPKTLGVWGPNGSRVVASEAMWREPVKWNRAAQAAYEDWHAHGMDESPPPERPRVFCASLADVLEDWTGPMVDSNGIQLSKIDSRPWTVRAHDDEPTVSMQDVRRRLFALIDATPNLDWLLLTKRPENIARMLTIPANGRDPGDPLYLRRENLWLGTSVENQQAADERIPHLLRVPAAVRFLSCEPLIGPVRLGGWCQTCNAPVGTMSAKCHADTVWPDWVIVGGESGPGARPMHPEWARGLRDQCQAAGVPFFFKQWGEWADYFHVRDELKLEVPKSTGSWATLSPSGQCERGLLTVEHMDRGYWPILRVGKKDAGRLLDGREWNEFPAVEAAS